MEGRGNTAEWDRSARERERDVFLRVSQEANTDEGVYTIAQFRLRRSLIRYNLFLNETPSSLFCPTRAQYPFAPCIHAEDYETSTLWLGFLLLLLLLLFLFRFSFKNYCALLSLRAVVGGFVVTTVR